MMEIDRKIVNYKYKHTENHRVEYCLYEDDTDLSIIPKDFPEKVRTDICFSFLHHEIANNKPANRIYIVLKDDKKASVKLTRHEKKAWIKMAKRYNLLPPYVNVTSIRTRKVVFDIEHLSPSQLYMYISSFRYLREDPGFVRAMVYLVEKKGMNFYIAFVLASRVCLNQVGHNIIDVARPYANRANFDELKLHIKWMIALRRYSDNPKKYDERKMHYNGDDRWRYFNCQDSIRKACKVEATCEIPDLYNDNLIKAIESDNDKVAKKYLEGAGGGIKMLPKQKPHIFERIWR